MILTYHQLALLVVNLDKFVLGSKLMPLLTSIKEDTRLLPIISILLLIMIQLLKFILEISVFSILEIMMVLINHLHHLLIQIKLNLEQLFSISLEMIKFTQLLVMISQRVMHMMLLNV